MNAKNHACIPRKYTSSVRKSHQPYGNSTGALWHWAYEPSGSSLVSMLGCQLKLLLYCDGWHTTSKLIKASTRASQYIGRSVLNLDVTNPQYPLILRAASADDRE